MKVNISDGLGLDHFIQRNPKARLPKISPTVEETSYLDPEDISGLGRKVKYVTYGCQMNVNDMEIVRSILKSKDYVETEELLDADVVVLITCSIREGAEDKVWRELRRIRHVARRKPIVGVLGCMAERVRHGLLSKKGLVDVVAGPDAYRDLPRLLAVARAGSSAINVQLSVEETYADVRPVRVDERAKTAFVSIMRGCDNMCTYCVVPLTRGRERSRPIDSIIEEVRRLSYEGVKQVTLLGQNVNSYRDMSESVHVMGEPVTTSTVPGFSTVYKPKIGGRTFLTLLDKISEIDPEMRIRFTSPHPKDFPVEVIQLIKERPNICNQLHLPAQSGDDAVLERMGRGYTRELYLGLVETIRRVLPDVSLTSDFIAGFCGETEEAHQKTVDLIHDVKYSFCYVFPYSMREKTRAHYRLVDDVPEDVKRRRHEELASAFREESLAIHQSLIGSEQLVLVEGPSKRSPTALQGRADSGSKVIFENTNGYEPGDYVVVRITGCSSQTMQGESLRRTTVKEFYG
ncbi:tRNA-i(6)A37 thiotransferase enzyme MiaB [Oesophagostomum dentatum]|uniref:CDK5RAP1-like protein n=1 Tax=Oesophagostomum dentatum TaxID=61180 RepID=A0A0B1SN74_OESDE|nr:tRNA-i(6)A37 thiotransferase enzyme MiaB [Oesophagostomum dentatum]